MTPSKSLPVSAADRLADLDPALARLPDAVSHAARLGWVLHDVRWSPGESCRLAYWLPEVAEAAPTFVAVRVHSAGWRCHDYRADPALAGLLDIGEPTHAARRLGSLLSTHVAGCRVRPVRYRPGSRAVLRYDIDDSADAGTWYAKVFPPDAIGELAARHQQVRSAAGRTGLVAEVSAVWPDVGAVVAREVSGRPLSGVLGDASVPAEQRLNLASQLGGLLAEFHHLPGVQAPHRSAPDQVRCLRALTPALHCADWSVAQRFTDLVDALDARVPDREPTVLTHGGFRAGQVALGADGDLTLLDLDGVCRGAACRDLATGMAHLSWQAVTSEDSRHVLEAARDCLVDGYQRRAGRLDQRALTWWQAAALLQVAGRRYRRLEVSDWDRVPVLIDAAEHLLTVGYPLRRSAPQQAIPDLLDLQRVSAELDASSQQDGGAAEQPVVAVSAGILATAPGRRTVVQYAVRGLGSDRINLLIGKHFTDRDRAGLLYRQLRDLADGLPHAPAVPRPVALLADGHLVMYRAAPGVPLDSIDDQAAAAAGVLAAARWLAVLHHSHVRLARHLDVRGESVTARQWAATIAEVRPELADSARELASGWVPAASSAATDGRAVALHKDFHAGHVLLADGQVCGIDLDEARHGPAVFDLAHFCTYLIAKGDPGCTLQGAFLQAYAEAAGQPAGTSVERGDASFAAWSAYTWLKIAKQRALRSGPWRGPGVDQQHGVADAVARGLACLAQ